MSMQVNHPFRIEVIFNTGFVYTIVSFSNSTDEFAPLTILDAIRTFYGNPIAFKVLQLNVDPTSSKFINWLEAEFKPLFDYDPILWLASVGTCPELAPLLIPFHKDS